MTIKIALPLTLVVGLSACASTTDMSAPSGTAADFGNSVNSLIKAQTANPATLSNPSTEPVTGVDPDYAGNVIEAMRESVQAAEVKEPIEIVVGGEEVNDHEADATAATRNRRGAGRHGAPGLARDGRPRSTPGT
jgi:hypothetical protein